MPNAGYTLAKDSGSECVAPGCCLQTHHRAVASRFQSYLMKTTHFGEGRSLRHRCPYRSLAVGAFFGVSWILLAPRASAVVVLSQYSHIYGSWREAGWIDENGRLTQPGEGGTPFETTSSFYHSSSGADPLAAAVRSEPFGFTSGRATTASFSLSLSADADPIFWGIEMGLDLNAQTLTRFRPEGSRLSLSAEGGASYNYYPHEQNVWLSLRDLTTGEILLSVNDIWPNNGDATKNYSFAVHPSHEYELDHGGFIFAFDAKEARLRSSLNLESVPESGPGLGLIVFTGIAAGCALVKSRFAVRRGVG